MADILRPFCWLLLKTTVHFSVHRVPLLCCSPTVLGGGVPKWMGHVVRLSSVYRPLSYVSLLARSYKSSTDLESNCLALMNQPKLITYHCGPGRNLIFLWKPWTRSRDSCCLYSYQNVSSMEIEIVLCCSLQYLHCPEPFLAHCRCSVDICCMNKWMVPFSFSTQMSPSYSFLPTWAGYSILCGYVLLTFHWPELVTWPHLAARKEIGTLFWEASCPIKK